LNAFTLFTNLKITVMKKAIFSSLVSLIYLAGYSQNVGIGTANPLEKLSVGITSQFRIDANGNIIRINNIPYSFPSIQGTANQILLNDGSGNLVWANAPAPAVSRPVVRIFAVVNNGGSTWVIDQPTDYASGVHLNPGLVLYRGLTYQFSVNAPGHPFRISTSVGGVGYPVGVTNNDMMEGILTFTVPMDAPNTLFYYCTVHAPMQGVLTIR
jgi:hypothetical protein